jgi:hypothetical protein
MSGAGWREPSPEEQALLATLVLADFPLRDAAAAQLPGLRVRDIACAGLTSLDLQVVPAAPRLVEGHPSTLVEAEGLDTAGHRFTAAIFAAEGHLTRLDIVPLEPFPLASPVPASLRQLDAIPRGTLELCWLVPRPHTILQPDRDR